MKKQMKIQSRSDLTEVQKRYLLANNYGRTIEEADAQLDEIQRFNDACDKVFGVEDYVST